ncbi:GNAT family N-acetyltransferase [Rhizohabitans arisaemae]|uniref:GNAT family N-acetyltransferase n=1 Tax=Rhizohabitans arisaemae TaxID=2720610 RepID=UPI0024B13DD6|nr:GNAT family N-acetyltransferase [Rhizohabitans arisaemae]
MSETVAAEVAAAQIALGEAAVRIRPGGWITKADGAVASVSNLDDASLNGVFALRADSDPEVVAGLLDRIAATGLPHSLRLRPGAGDALRAMAADRGFTLLGELPLLVLDRDDLRRPPEPEELTVRRLDPGEAGIVAGFVADGLGLSPAVARDYLSPRLFELPGNAAYVGEVGGRAVVTGLGFAAREHVSVGGIVTDPAHRRRGYGAALTAAVLADAFTRGSRRAFLQSSPMGMGVYEALGFRLLERQTIWSGTSDVLAFDRSVGPVRH